MKANASFHNACILADCLNLRDVFAIDEFIENERNRYETDDCGNIVKIDGLTVTGGNLVYVLR